MIPSEKLLPNVTVENFKLWFRQQPKDRRATETDCVTDCVMVRFLNHCGYSDVRLGFRTITAKEVSKTVGYHCLPNGLMPIPQVVCSGSTKTYGDLVELVESLKE